MIKPQTLKGFRDFLPKQMAIRQKVSDILRQVFESYGFQPLQTPTLEYADLLTNKYGQEADRLIYSFKDRGGRQVGLNYDLTVPTARVLAEYPNLPKPFKRYQIQPAYRAENTQKGRYRQFTQCDIDTFAVSSPLADAEILKVTQDALTALKFTRFSIRINSRQILFKALDQSGISKDKAFTLLQSLDKLDKKSLGEVTKEVEAKGIDSKKFQELNNKLKNTSPDSNLQQVIDLSKKMGVKNIEFFPTLVRGLDYYTGTIFEVVVEKPNIGSIAGGGRYDNLIEQLGGPSIPAVGTTLGLDRICDIIEELKLYPELYTNSTRILITIFSPTLLDNSITLFNTLHSIKVPSELYPNPNAHLDKQLKYANNKKIPYITIIGPEEQKNNTISLKNLSSGEQKTYSLNNLESLAQDVSP